MSCGSGCVEIKLPLAEAGRQADIGCCLFGVCCFVFVVVERPNERPTSEHVYNKLGIVIIIITSAVVIATSARRSSLSHST